MRAQDCEAVPGDIRAESARMLEERHALIEDTAAIRARARDAKLHHIFDGASLDQKRPNG